jgi:hypothetical protein
MLEVEKGNSTFVLIVEGLLRSESKHTRASSVVGVAKCIRRNAEG